ncbi:MAG: HIT domain-containing protein [Nanoarchaeota archaeon]
MTCELCEGKKELLYEDEVIKIAHAGEASRGHILIFPKQHTTAIDEIPEALLEHLFFSGSYAAAVLFELLGAHGTNIIMSEKGHVAIDIIERKQDDGLNFLWKPKQVPPEEMDTVLSRIKDALVIGKAAVEEKPVVIKQDVEVISEGDGNAENYLIKSLDRIP